MSVRQFGCKSGGLSVEALVEPDPQLGGLTGEVEVQDHLDSGEAGHAASTATKADISTAPMPHPLAFLIEGRAGSPCVARRRRSSHVKSASTGPVKRTVPAPAESELRQGPMHASAPLGIDPAQSRSEGALSPVLALLTTLGAACRARVLRVVARYPLRRQRVCFGDDVVGLRTRSPSTATERPRSNVCQTAAKWLPGATGSGAALGLAVAGYHRRQNRKLKLHRGFCRSRPPLPPTGDDRLRPPVRLGVIPQYAGLEALGRNRPTPPTVV